MSLLCAWNHVKHYRIRDYGPQEAQIYWGDRCTSQVAQGTTGTKMKESLLYLGLRDAPVQILPTDGRTTERSR